MFTLIFYGPRAQKFAFAHIFSQLERPLRTKQCARKIINLKLFVVNINILTGTKVVSSCFNKTRNKHKVKQEINIFFSPTLYNLKSEWIIFIFLESNFCGHLNLSCVPISYTVCARTLAVFCVSCLDRNNSQHFALKSILFYSISARDPVVYILVLRDIRYLFSHSSFCLFKDAVNYWYRIAPVIDD